MNNKILHSFTNLFGFGCFVVFSSRLYVLQCFQNSHLLQLVKTQQKINIEKDFLRSSIFDDNNNLLSFQEETYDCYANDKFDSYKDLAKEFELPFFFFKRHNSNESFCIRDVPKVKLKIIQSLGLFDPLYHLKRLYPYRGVYAPILGYVNNENIGQAGLEMILNKKLIKNSIFTPSWVDAQGIPIGKQIYYPFFQTSKVYLTVNSQLQEQVYQILKKGFNKFSPKRLGAIVMEINTGSIKSWNEYPTYDSNKYSDYDVGNLTSWMATDYFEPGSTWKPINIAIGLETKILNKDDLILDIGEISLSNHKIKNAFQMSNSELFNITDIIRFSSNIGMIEILKKIPLTIYYDWLLKLNIGNKSTTTAQISYPFTSTYIKSLNFLSTSTLDFFSLGIGQGLSLTVLKLIQICSSIGNGGFLVTPHFTKQHKIFTNDISTLFLGPIPLSFDSTFPKKKVFSKDTSDTISKILEQTVLWGTANNAFIQGYELGGKTGTAQQANDKLGYQDISTSFVSFYPIKQPKYIIYVIIDKPSYPYLYASNTAVELGKSIIQEIILLENDMPTKPRTFIYEKNSKVKKLNN